MVIILIKISFVRLIHLAKITTVILNDKDKRNNKELIL